MQNAIRTTIRIRKDLIEQSRMLAHTKRTSLQNVINETLAIGYKHITDLNTAKESMKQIDSFRFSTKKKKINLKKLIAAGRSDQK